MKHIVPECFVDTTLVRILVGSLPRHQKGIPKVKKSILNLSTEFPKVIGLMDNDKRESSFFDTLKTESKKLDIIHKSEGNKHYIIVNPAIEKFILACCTESEIKIEQFGFSNNLDTLKNHSATMALRPSKQSHQTGHAGQSHWQAIRPRRPQISGYW